MKVNKTAILTMRFSKQEMDILRGHAEHHDVSVGHIVRRAINDMFKAGENGIH